MTRRTHAAIGILAGLICCEVLQVPKIEVISGAVNTAMLPDIDQHIKKLGHREFTHSLVIPVLLYLAYVNVHNQSKYIILGLIIGWVSHILMDMLNGKGAEILWPCKRNFRIGKMKYSGKGERAIFILACVGITILLIGIGNIENIVKGWIR